MKKLFLLIACFLITGCIHHATVQPAIDNAKYTGDYISIVSNGAHQRHKWQNIYIEEPRHTVAGWSGRLVLTHSGTFDEMYVYTIEPSGFVKLEYAGIDRDEIDRIKFIVNQQKNKQPAKKDNAILSKYYNTVFTASFYHEYGDTKPSEFSYVSFNNDKVIIYDIDNATVTTLTLFKITSINGSTVSAKPIASYLEIGKNKYEKNNDYSTPIKFSVVNNKLIFDCMIYSDGIFKKTNLSFKQTYPQQFIKEYSK